MFTIPVKGKSIDELSSKINELVNQYPDCEIYELNYETPSLDNDWYSCLILIVKDE